MKKTLLSCATLVSLSCAVFLGSALGADTKKKDTIAEFEAAIAELQEAVAQLQADVAALQGLEQDIVDLRVPSLAAAAIQAARDAADACGGCDPDVSVEGARVTYISAPGGDASGFYIQSLIGGPALFVEVDPDSLPPFSVGNLVSLDIDFVTIGFGVRKATAIGNFVVLDSGAFASDLVQNVGAVSDLVSDFDKYESEIVTAELIIKDDGSVAQAGFHDFSVDTAAIISNPDLKLNAADGVIDTLGLRSGCTIRVDATPVSRFNATVLLIAERTGDLADVVCPPGVSAAIQLARDSAASCASASCPTDVPISGARVSYVVPAVGATPGSFYIQGEQAGPALLIDVDPLSLPPFDSGNVVNLRITSVALVSGQALATAVTDLAIVDAGTGIADLIQDIGGIADFVANVEQYESELVAAGIVLTSNGTFAGAGFLQFSVETPAVTGNANLKLRVPNDLATTLALDAGCTAEAVGVPVNRFNAEVQLAAWRAQDLASVTCP
jgi:hypothetical protein